MRIALVVSRYHAFVTDRLEAGARACLRGAGLADSDVVTFSVPGAFEIPQVASKAATAGGWDAVVCLGCLIRGETPHFDYIAQAVAVRAPLTRGMRPPPLRSKWLPCMR
jgi:6,7-dimethyl-8-ribityllumazine synthase